MEFLRSADGVDWGVLKAALVADSFNNGRSPEEYRRSHENSHAYVILRDGPAYVGVGLLLRVEAATDDLAGLDECDNPVESDSRVARRLSCSDAGTRGDCLLGDCADPNRACWTSVRGVGDRFGDSRSGRPARRPIRGSGAGGSRAQDITTPGAKSAR